MPARPHANRRLVDAQKVIGTHDIIERLYLEHDMLQAGRLAWHAGRERQTVMALVAAQETQTDLIVDINPITQAKAQHAGVEIMRTLGVLDSEQHMAQTQNLQIPRVVHRFLVNSEAV